MRPLRYTALLLATIVLVLAGCRIETPTLRSAKVKQFEKGNELRTWTLTDTQLQAVSDWLARQRSGWYPTPATFAPSLTLAGMDANEQAFTLNVRTEEIVVNGPKGQFMKQFPPEDLDALRRLLAAES